MSGAVFVDLSTLVYSANFLLMEFMTMSCNGLRISYFSQSQLFTSKEFLQNPTPLQSSRIITYVDDPVIFTSSSNFDDIERNLNNDITNLSTWFHWNELTIDFKKEKTESMIFRTTTKKLNRLQEKQLNLTVNVLPINNIS